MMDTGDKQATRLVPRKFMPWEGFRFTLDDCSIYASTISILQPGLQFTEKEFGAYFNRVATLLDGLAKNPIREIGPHKPLHEPPSVRVPLTLYKYVTEDTYDRFIKRGRLRLGSLSYYRRVENIQARDEWEGFAIVNLTGNAQEIFSSVLSGFEYAILCLSTLSTRDLSMESKFGRVLLRIHDVPGRYRPSQG